MATDKDKSLATANFDYARTNEYAEIDRKLPAFVRAFLILHCLNATWKIVLDEVGIGGDNYRLYGMWAGEPVRVVMVSRMGDIGISRHDQEHGYFTRCSIYDVTDYSQHPVGKMLAPER